jgi:hypothetical protein
VKKAELKAGTAYYVTSRNNRMDTYHDSCFKTHQQHKSNRHYVIFESDGQPKTGYRSASVIWMTTCPTYGFDCPTHGKDGKLNCYRTDFRLMDIRDEYWSVIKRMHQRRKERPTKDIRAERLVRIAKREQTKQETPIKEEFYSVLKQISNRPWLNSSSTLGGFTIEQMQAITNALKAGLAVEIRVAS